MATLNKYPYHDYNDLNLDWLIKTVKETVAEWAVYNTEWENWKNDLTNYVMNYFDTLDLTEELTEVLHRLDEDGTLEDMITPYFNAWSADILQRISAVESAVGGPLVSSTVAGMTDHTKVYVYTGSETGYTAGNWYYWNGSAWTSGGTYQAALPDGKNAGEYDVFPISENFLKITRSGTAFVVDALIPPEADANFLIVGQPGGTAKAVRYSALNLPITVPANSCLAYDLDNDTFGVFAYNQNVTFANYKIVARNHYGFLQGDWTKYINQELLVRNAGNWIVEPGVRRHLEFTDLGGNNFSIDLNDTTGNALNVMPPNGPLQVVSYVQSGFPVTLNSGSVLVYDTESATNRLKVASSAAVIASPTRYVILLVNYLGNFTGPWAAMIRDRSDDAGRDFPPYFDAQVDAKVPLINTAGAKRGMNFAFITDEHCHSNRFNSLPLLQYLVKSCPIDIVLSGGDYVYAYGADSAIYDEGVTGLMQYAAGLYPRWFSLRGNHDFTIKTDAATAAGYTYDDADTFNWLARSADRWKMVVPEPAVDFLDNASNIYKNYCFVLENAADKVAVIAFCDYNTTDATTYYGVGINITDKYAAYLVQLLTAYSDYDIILATHAPITDKLTSGIRGKILTAAAAFNSRGSGTFGSYAYNFSGATGRVMLAVSGHGHKDGVTIDSGVICTETTCDAPYANDVWTRTVRTETEQAFDIMLQDADGGIVRMFRIGAGVNRFVHTDVIALSTPQTLVPEITAASWATSDAAVCTVSNGTITAAGSGSAIVTATDADGNIETWGVTV